MRGVWVDIPPFELHGDVLATTETVFLETEGGLS